MTYDTDWALRWLNDFGERGQENKQLLSDLDQAICDGDHGINMARG
ncbi:dihydroxyacetone kinase subunit L, partial [Listeria monocytogenes]|nr:dihydroxyacetone kinase subunit L [Listeria monocytogenes]